MEDIAGEVEKIGSAISSDIEIYLKKKELVKLFDHFLSTLSERDRDIFIRRYPYVVLDSYDFIFFPRFRRLINVFLIYILKCR